MSDNGPVFQTMSTGGLARRLLTASGAALGLLLVGCGTLSQSDLVRKARADPNSLLVVDCLLAPRVVNMGLAMTYTEASQAIKTTALDCGIRGGKYVAYDRANYATALEVWLGRAKAGDAEAETNVGEIYEKGMGLPADYAAAAKWYEKAAAKGYSRAQVNLGYLYEKGLGVSKDLATAVNWYRKASGLTGDDLTFASSIQSEAQTQVAEAKAEISVLSSQLEASRHEIETLHQRLESTQTQMEGSQEKLRQTLDSLEKTRSEAEKLKSAPPEQQRQNLPRLDQEIKEKQTKADEEIAALKKHEDQFQRENGELLNKLAKAEQRATQLNLQLDKNKFETAQLQAKLAQTDASLGQLKLDYQARQQQSVAPVPVPDGKLKELEAQLAQRESELQSQRTRIGELEREKARVSEEKNSLEKQVGLSASQRDKSLESVSKQFTTVANSLKDEKERADRLAQEKDRLAAELSQHDAAQQQSVGKTKEQLQAMAKQIENYAKERSRLAKELEEARKRPQQTAALNVPAGTKAEPKIEVIDPPLSLTRGTPSIKLRSIVPSRAITGSALAPAGVMSLMINDHAEAVTETGLFKSEIRLEKKETPVNITLVDKRGSKASLDFTIVVPDQGEKPVVAEQPKPSGGLNYGRYYALVIGNNRYTHSDLPSLDTPISDATAVSKVLKELYGFETKELSNATRYDILTALNQFRDKLTEKDNFLIYYAGHGELDKVNQRGQWLPVDAERGNTANWISTDAITDILNTISAKHILVVADSCYSGAMTRASLAVLESGVSEEVKEKWLRKMLGNKSRTVLTSGGLQPVLDSGSGGHSIFARALIDALTKNDEVLPGQSLFRLVCDKVWQAAARLGFDQAPQYAPIR